MKNRLDTLLFRVGDMALKRRVKWVFESLDLRECDSVLDVGCGDGFFLYLLSNIGLNLKLIGIDLNKKALASAKSNLRSKEILLLNTQAEKLPFKANSFDRVVLSEILEHVIDPVLVLKEANRVLRSEGRIVVSVPYTNYPFLWDPPNWLLQHIFRKHISEGFWAGIWSQHLRLYDEEELLRELKKTKFKNIKLEKLTHYCLPFNHYLINIVARILAETNSSMIRNNFSKFHSCLSNDLNISSMLFRFLDTVDKLNDKWNKKDTAVSLVASAKK